MNLIKNPKMLKRTFRAGIKYVKRKADLHKTAFLSLCVLVARVLMIYEC